MNIKQIFHKLLKGSPKLEAVVEDPWYSKDIYEVLHSNLNEAIGFSNGELLWINKSLGGFIYAYPIQRTNFEKPANFRRCTHDLFGGQYISFDYRITSPSEIRAYIYINDSNHFAADLGFSETKKLIEYLNKGPCIYFKYKGTAVSYSESKPNLFWLEACDGSIVYKQKGTVSDYVNSEEMWLVTYLNSTYASITDVFFVDYGLVQEAKFVDIRGKTHHFSGLVSVAKISTSEIEIEYS